MIIYNGKVPEDNSDAWEFLERLDPLLTIALRSLYQSYRGLGYTVEDAYKETLLDHVDPGRARNRKALTVKHMQEFVDRLGG